MQQAINTQLNVPLVGTIGVTYQELKQEIQIAMAHKHEFIELKRHRDGNIIERIYPVDGLRHKESKDSRTNTTKHYFEQRDDAGLYFIPNDITGEMYGYLLDTDKNRQMLATHLLEDRWEIIDKEIDADIRERASKLKIEFDPTFSNANELGGKSDGQIRDSMTTEQLAGVIEARKKELELLQKIKKEAEPDNAAGQIKDNSDKQEEKPDEALVEMCRQRVHNEVSEVVAELKRQYKSKYMESKDYKDFIQPEVDKAVSREMAKKK